MGFLSRIFGESKEDKALNETFKHIKKILEDEQYQIEMLGPTAPPVFSKYPAFDRDPNGSGPFGFVETNPIPVNGPIGELAYLSRLETSAGERILFHRIGAIDKIDVYEAVSFSGSEWFILYLDYYHPRRSRALPEGFHWTKVAPQFCGFHRLCLDFPYDFPEKKQSLDKSGLSVAYMAIHNVATYIQNRAYRRPASHNAKLDIVKAKLTTLLMQE